MFSSFYILLSSFKWFVLVFDVSDLISALCCLVVLVISEHYLGDLKHFGTILGKNFFSCFGRFILLLNGFEHFLPVFLGFDRFSAFVSFGCVSRFSGLQRWFEAFWDQYGDKNCFCFEQFLYFWAVLSILNGFWRFCLFCDICVVLPFYLLLNTL